MKVLLRSDYKWHEATFNPATRKIVTGNGPVYETDIVSVQDDERKKYVICSGCNEIIKNTPAAIRKHAALHSTEAGCLTCSSMRPSSCENEKVKYKKNEDGTYSRSSKGSVKLYCNNTYRPYTITSAEARNRCKYAGCSNLPREFDSVFIKYPGAFDEMITIDALDKAGWQFKQQYASEYWYKTKSRNNLIAAANNMGIVNKFLFTYHKTRYVVFYSRKYKKFFTENGRTYSEFNTEMSESSVAVMLKKIDAIYKGVE